MKASKLILARTPPIAVVPPRAPMLAPGLCRPRCTTAFATVLTLLIIAFLVVVLVGSAMLLRVETFTSSNAQKIVEARQNALYGLETAIADLQELAGPDQRVTATADILNTGNATAATSSAAPTVLGKTKWTGVWKRDESSGDTPLNPTDDKAPKWLGWLVSGPEGKNQEGNTSAAPPKIPSPASATDSSVTLVGNSVSTIDDQIAVTLVTMHGNTGNLTGRYGFWVGDEGVKARFNMGDPHPAPTDQEARNAFSAPPTLNMKEAGLLGPTFPTDGSAARSFSTEQIPYLTANNSLDGKEKSLFHSLTAWSKGILADTRLGGLRKDLSRILYSSSIGPSDTTPLYPNYLLTSIGLNGNGTLSSNDVYGFRAPTWGLLRSWANNTISVNATSVAAREANAISSNSSDVSSVGPIVLYYNLGFGATFGNNTITPYIFPCVILWNPYTVTLDPPANGYELGIKMGNPNSYSNILQFGSNGTTGNSTVVHDLQEFCLSNGTWSPAPATVTGKLYRFSLDPISIPPGEALVYAVDSPGSAYTDGMLLSLNYSPHNAGARIGPALSFTPATTTVNGTVTPNPVKIGGRGGSPQNSCYLITKPAGNSTAAIDKTSPCFAYITGETGSMWGNGTSGQSLEKAFTSAAILNSTPTLRFSNGGVHAMGQLKLPSVGNYDFRWLMNFNPRGMVYFGAYPWKSATLAETATEKSRSFPMALFERVNSAFSAIIPYSDTLGHIENIGNDLGSPVASAPAASMGGRFALFDLPRTEWPLFSVADLRHADLVRQAGGPPYAVGGSLATIGLLREEDHRPGFPNYVDWSHVLNRELWDGYFFSTVPSNLPSDFRSQAAFKHLPNARMRYHGNAANTDILDKDKAAASLTLEGAFNINSTSEDAWVALLSDRVGLKYDVKTAAAISSGSLPGAAFSRFNRPINHSALPAVGTSGDPWGGFRSLSADQIRELAKAIVAQIKSRASALGGPFLTLGEFVNRRLVPNTDPHAAMGLSGALQSAIDNTATINTAAELTSNTMNATSTPSNFDATKSDPEHWRGEAAIAYPQSSRNAGIPGMLIQPDLLAAIGPHIAARSDTFRIRSYGDVVNPRTAKVEARAWCEAVVQRLPEYLDPSDPPETPTANLTKDINKSAGRRFQVVSFRWLTPDEV